MYFLKPRSLGAQPEPCMVTHTEELGQAPQYRRAHPRCPAPITTITTHVGDERQQDTHVRGFDTAVHLGELAVRQAEYLRAEEPPDVTYTMAGAPVCVCTYIHICMGGVFRATGKHMKVDQTRNSKPNWRKLSSTDAPGRQPVSTNSCMALAMASPACPNNALCIKSSKHKCRCQPGTCNQCDKPSMRT